MLIRFGLHLDGLHPQTPATAVGEVTLGPLGFLEVLETQLGLPGVVATSTDVLMAYRACLAEVNHPTRFYHASFEVDPINVSRTLLAWRATLYEHGWAGEFAADAPVRLCDLGDVERLAMLRVALNRGQRVQRATAALAQCDTQIAAVELLDAVADLPIVWRRLLEKLPFTVAPGVTAVPHASNRTDLHVVQSTLTALGAAGPAPAPGAAMPRRKIRLRGDGSFVVLRGASRDITAQAVAECINAVADRKPVREAMLVVAERDGIVLDNAFERAGLPRAGFQHFSSFRAVTQVLKLALSLLWRPVSVQLLLQFLIHPVGPLPRHVRDAFADALSQQPGIGGRQWSAALSAIETRMRDEFGADANAIATMRSAIDTWLDGERFDPAAGAPIETIARRTQLCSTYLATRLAAIANETEAGLYASALGQSEALLRALRSLAEQDRPVVTRIDLDRLIDDVSSVAPDPNTFAQARHVRATTDPATVTQTWQRIFWWDLAMPRDDVSYPWSRKEIGWLRANGVSLADVEEVLRRRTRQWLRPILSARDHLTLVVHDSEQGYHPMWTQIDNLFDGFVEVRIDDALLNGETLPDVGIETRTLPVNPLPAPRRWWRLPHDVSIPSRDVESYSSLSKLFDWPHGYVLRYAARLRTGRAQDLADDNRLYGNLAHGLFERFFNENPLWAMLDESAIWGWLSSELPHLIETEGAMLLEAGRGVDAQHISGTLERALIALIEHLRSARIETVQPECHGEAAFKRIRIGGAIDLLLTDHVGRETVLDVKWGGEAYRARDLSENRHLQLAMYAYLRRSGQRFPEQAYFIVEPARVLAQSAATFPGAALRPPRNNESVIDLWQRIGASYDWRRRQLDAGLVEVNVAATTPTDESTPPLTALDVANAPDPFDDFVNLTGWSDYQ